MGETSADVRTTDAPRARRLILFGLLLAVQFAAAVLVPLDTDNSDAFWTDFSIAGLGASLAWPPILAVWAVFGSQRAVVRLPWTFWLAAALNLAGLFGLNQSAGDSHAQLLIINGAWFVAFAAFQPPLWLIRAVRRWRLEGALGEAAAGTADTKATFQFSLRGLLGWTLGVALLLAALRWLAPTVALDAEQIFQLAPEAALVGLMVTLGGLPAVALAWIVLADGRRPILRIVLSLLIVSGVGACGLVRVNGESPIREIVLLEGGAMLNALLGLGVLRACGFRLRRRSKAAAATPAPSGVVPAPLSRRRFAFVLAPLVLVAAVLAASVPHRLEMWRQAEVSNAWLISGIRVTFDDDGKLTGAEYNPQTQMSDDLCRRLAALDDLVTLNLTRSALDDRQLALLTQLAKLQELNLSGTAVSDAGLKQLAQFPRLVSLNLVSTPITDAGMEQLKRLPNLRELQLSLTDVSDAGLFALEEMSALKNLYAQLTAVTAAGAEKLRKRRPQTTIEVGACDALFNRLPLTLRTTGGGRAFGVARDSIKLKRLHARGQAVENGVSLAVTDAGLVTLSVVQTELEELDLRDSAVTDKGLWSLRALKQLKRLDMRGAPVTEQGVARLARVLPGCEILR